MSIIDFNNILKWRIWIIQIIYFNNVFIHIHICDCANDIWQVLKFIISIKVSKKKRKIGIRYSYQFLIKSDVE